MTYFSTLLVAKSGGNKLANLSTLLPNMFHEYKREISTHTKINKKSIV